MASLTALKKYYGSASSIGMQIKAEADRIMDETFDLDVTTRVCYLYDYFHDDEQTKDFCEYGVGYTPPEGSAKIPVKLKFLIKSYKSLAKDDPDYYIQFTMSDWNQVTEDPENQMIVPEYFGDYARFGVHFPVGLYVDIPDDRGVYWRWLIVYEDVANQFPKFGIVRCNYQLDWVINKPDGRYKRKMWGAQRTQSSSIWCVIRGNSYDELPFNCWKTVRALHHSIEMKDAQVRRFENVRIWKSAAKPRIGERSTVRLRSRRDKCPEMGATYVLIMRSIW